MEITLPALKIEARRMRILALQEDSTAVQSISPSVERIIEHFDNSTADENEPSVDGRETDEQFEDQALSLLKPLNLKQRQKEMEYLDRIIDLGEKVRETLQEAKFLKLRELIESAEFQNEKILIFTEHRDTLDYLRQRFEALGYTGQIASIHGGMDVEEREQQRNFFMPRCGRPREASGTPHPVSRGTPSSWRPSSRRSCRRRW